MWITVTEITKNEKVLLNTDSVSYITDNYKGAHIQFIGDVNKYINVKETRREIRNMMI